MNHRRVDDINSLFDRASETESDYQINFTGNTAPLRRELDRLQDEIKETGRDFKVASDASDRFSRSTEKASASTSMVTRNLTDMNRVAGNVRSTLIGIGIGTLVRGLGELSANTIRAAGELEQLERATTQITGSAALAANRLDSLIDIANQPGLNFRPLVEYSNRLQAAGVAAEDTDTILRTTGVTILSLGGTAQRAAEAVEQIVQAFQQADRIDLRDFRTIIQQIPSFLETAADVHGVEANIEGLRTAFDALGQDMRALLIPVFDELSMRFEEPPPDSYIVSIDTLKNSFFLLQAEIGEQALPAVAAFARGLAATFDTIREFIDNTDDAKVAQQAFSDAVRNSNSVVESSDAISGRITQLGELIATLETTRQNLGLFDKRGRTGISAEIVEATEQLQNLQDISIGSPEKIAELNAELERLNMELGDVQSQQTDLNNTAARFGTAEQRRFETRRTNLQAQEDAIVSQITETENLRDTAVAAFKGTLEAQRQDISSKNEAVRATRDLAEVTVQAVNSTERFTPTIISAEQAIAAQLTPSLQASALAAAGFTGDIYELQSRLERYAEYGARLDAFSVRVVDAEAEKKALEEVTALIVQQTQDAEGLAHVYKVLEERTDAHNAALVNPAVSDAVQSLSEYSHIIGDVNLSYEQVIPITQDFVDGLGRQASALDDLREKTGAAELSLDIFENAIGTLPIGLNQSQDAIEDVGKELIKVRDDFRNGEISAEEANEAFENIFDREGLPNTLQREIANVITSLDKMEISAVDAEEKIGLLVSSFETFGHDGVLEIDDVTAAIGRLGDGLADADGNIGAVGTGLKNLSDLFTNPLNFAVDTLGYLLGPDGFFQKFGGELGLPDDFFTPEATTPGRGEVIRGGQSLDEAKYQDFVDIVLGRRGGYEDPIGFLLENAPGLIQQYKPLIDVDPRLGSSEIYDRLFPQATGPISSFTRSPDFDVDAEYAATFEGAEAAEAAELLRTLDLTNLQNAADTAITTFTDAITAPQATIESIDAAFTALEPSLRELYDFLFESISGEDGIINTTQEKIDFAELGTFEQFITPQRELAENAKTATAQAQQRLRTTSAQIAATDGFKNFSEAVNAPGVTIESLIANWDTNVVPLIDNLYDELFAEIAGPDGFINTTAETEAFLRLDSREDYHEKFRGDLLSPALEGIRTTAENIQILLNNQELEETLQGFSADAIAPGATIESITQNWDTDVVPVLRNVYTSLREQIIGSDGLISDTELEQLISRGLDKPFEDWAMRFEVDIRDPAIDRLISIATALQGIQNDRSLDAAITLFNAAVKAPGTTRADIEAAWRTIMDPVLRRVYEDERAAIIGPDGLIDPDEALQLAQVGLDVPFEDWASQFVTNIKDPALANIASIASGLQGIQNDRSLDAAITLFNAAVKAPGATRESIIASYATHITPALQAIYEHDRNVIIGEDAEISPAEELALTQAGLDVPFEDWALRYDTDLLQPALSSNAQTAQRLASLTEDQTLAEAIKTFNAAVKAPGATRESILSDFSQNVEPLLRANYQNDRAAIIGTDGLISASEEIELRQAGLHISEDDYVALYRTDLLDPALAAMNTAAATLTDAQTDTTLEGVINNFKMQVAAPNATLESIANYWNDVVIPAARERYNFLYNQIAGPDGLINTAEEQAKLLLLGTEEEFIAGFNTDIFNPLLAGFNTRQTTTGLTSQRNRVNFARFALRSASSESEFETLRGILRTETNAYFDLEEKRIDALKLSEADLQNRRDANALERLQALQAVDDLENKFTTERIKADEDAAADKLKAEKELADDIEDLRDEQVENEERRKERLLDIEKSYQDELQDIRKDEREAGLDILDDQKEALEDLRTRVARDLFSDAINFDDLTPEQQRQVTESTAFRRGQEDINTRSQREAYDFRQEFGLYRAGTKFGDTGIEQVMELLRSGEITPEQATPFIGSRRVDAFTEQQAATETAELQAMTIATGLQTALEPLITQQQTTATTEAMTAQTNATTATTESATAIANASNAEMFGTGIAALSAAIPSLTDFSEVPTAITTAVETAISEADIQSLVIVNPTAIDIETLDIIANTVNVSGGRLNFPRGGGSRQERETIEIHNNITLSDNVLIEQQSRTEQLTDRLII